MLRIARVNLEREGLRNCHVRLADMYRLPWADGSFDCAVLHQVLHYAEHPPAVIAEAARVLRPDGRLLIVDFAPHKLDELRRSHAHRWLGFADDAVASWCEASGLEVERTRRLRGRPLVVSIWRARRHAPGMPVEGRRAA
jgi:ArsR family transcriptional regulator